MQYQSYIEQGRVRCPLFSFQSSLFYEELAWKVHGRFLMLLQDKDAETVFGLIIYSLERLYRVVENPAKASGEWDL